MTYACQEHVELAMDTIMDEDEALPIIEKTTTKKNNYPQPAATAQKPLYTQ